MRRLVGVCGLLVAGLDSANKQSYVHCGLKMELAASLAAGLHSWDPDQLWAELQLLQPSWLALLVSRQLARVSGSGVAQVTAALAQLELEPVARVAAVSQLYRGLATAQLHAVARVVWARRSSAPLTTFALMARLDRVKEAAQEKERQVVRLRSGVSVKVAPMVEDLNTIAQYIHGTATVPDTAPSILALLFKMSSCDNF